MHLIRQLNIPMHTTMTNLIHYHDRQQSNYSIYPNWTAKKNLSTHCQLMLNIKIICTNLQSSQQLQTATTNDAQASSNFATNNNDPTASRSTNDESASSAVTSGRQTTVQHTPIIDYLLGRDRQYNRPQNAMQCPAIADKKFVKPKKIKPTKKYALTAQSQPQAAASSFNQQESVSAQPAADLTRPASASASADKMSQKAAKAAAAAALNRANQIHQSMLRKQEKLQQQHETTTTTGICTTCRSNTQFNATCTVQKAKVQAKSDQHMLLFDIH
jgi:hypothetical protein